MKKFIFIGIALLIAVLLLTPQTRQVIAQAGEKLPYLRSLFVSQRLVMSPDATTSTQSAEIYFEAGTPDQAEYIYGSVDGQLDLVAGTEVEVTATIVDLQTDSVTSGTGFWSGAPSMASNNPATAFWYFNDFIATELDSANGAADYTGGGAGVAITGTNANVVGWKAIGDAGYTLTSAAGSLGGWLLFTVATGSNNELYMQMGALGTETFVECTSNSGNEWWLEFSVTPSSVTNAANWFVGLAEEGAAATNLINDSGADIADKDVILMGVYEGDTNNLIGIWQTAGAAFDSALSTQAITAANMELGFHFDGQTTLTYYFNGSAVATQAITATGFPDTEELSPIIAMKEGASAITLNVDWVKLVSER